MLAAAAVEPILQAVQRDQVAEEPAHQVAVVGRLEQRTGEAAVVVGTQVKVMLAALAS